MSRTSAARIDGDQQPNLPGLPALPGLFAAVGRTPLVRLRHIAAHLRHVELYAKAEHLNPSGSVKDRAARAILEDGLRRGRLRPGHIVLEATLTKGHEHAGFYLCSAAFAVVLVVYRLWWLRSRSRAHATSRIVRWSCAFK